MLCLYAAQVHQYSQGEQNVPEEIKNTKIEIDVIGMKGLMSVFISCKTGAAMM